jgi:predicted KAP-like P-loop ATPase
VPENTIPPPGKPGSPPDQRHPFSADRPILTRTQDRLARAGFAETLASSIANWRGRESIVIGIYGPWGVGKTSIKNLVIERLKSAADHPEILEFNPWRYHDDDLLRRAFFDELGRAVRRTDASSAARAVVRHLKVYDKMLAAGESVSGGIPKAVPIVIGALGLIGLGSSLVRDVLALPWVPAVSGSLVVLAGILASLRRLIGWLSDGLTNLSGTADQPVPELKRKIAGLLGKRSQPVLVIMDDVDRLRSEEIRSLFQLIKVNADFPNVIYLALFQRDVIEGALGDGDALQGRQFLEKIVQVGFDVPDARPDEIHAIFFEGLYRILERHLEDCSFDKTRWANIFLPGLSYYFDSLRDVARYLSTLDFQFSRLSETGTLEVDPIDLIAIETLRLFEPEVFHVLRVSKDLLTGADSGQAGQNEAAQKASIMTIVAVAAEQHRPWITEILRRLFPTIEWVFGGSRYGGSFFERWERDLRMCTPAFFDRYFRFGLAAGDLSHADLQRALSESASRDELRAHLLALHERGLLPLLFDRLEAHKQERARGNAAAFVTAIFDVGDLLPEGTAGFAAIDPIMHAHRVVSWFLRSERDLDIRQQIAEEGIERTTGLILPVQLVAFEHSSKDEQKEANERIISVEALPRVRRLCATRIAAAAEAGNLLSSAHLVELLFRWLEWGDAATAQKWVDTTIQVKENVPAFLQGFVQVSRSYGMGDHASRSRSYMSLKALKRLVDVPTLEKHVLSIDASGLCKSSSEAVALFLRAVNRERSGKPNEPDLVGFDEGE